MDRDARGHGAGGRPEPVQAQERFVLVALFDPGNLNLLDQSLPVRLERSQPVHEVVGVPVGGAIAQGKQRVKADQRLDAQFTLHVLRFVEDQDGAGGLDKMDRRLALKAVGALANDVRRLVERVNGHHHELDTV